MIHCDTNLSDWPKPRTAGRIGVAIAAVALTLLGCSDDGTQTPRLEGLVFHDADGNTIRNDREKGLGLVPVSNGREVVLTDVRGRWFLPTDGPRTPFVIAPRGWHHTTSTQPNLVALEPWTPSPSSTVHVGGLVDSAPPPDATIGFGNASAPLPHSDTPDTLPTAFNVGDMHIIVVDDRTSNADNLAFVEADLLHAGAARPVLMLLITGRGDVVQLLGDRPSIVTAFLSDDMPFAIGFDAKGELVTYGFPPLGESAP